MSKRRKPQRSSAPDGKDQIAATFTLLHTLRQWEDQLIRQLETQCSTPRRRKRVTDQASDHPSH